MRFANMSGSYSVEGANLASGTGFAVYQGPNDIQLQAQPGIQAQDKKTHLTTTINFVLILVSTSGGKCGSSYWSCGRKREVDCTRKKFS
jgi:hypothetical protein